MRPLFCLRRALLRPSPSTTTTTIHLPQPINRQRLFSRLSSSSRQSPPLPFRHRRFFSSQPPPNPTAHLGSPPAQSLSQRMRKLSREYGWSAVGVYFALSAADFPFCFLAVRVVGTERIGWAEAYVMGWFWAGVEKVLPSVAAARRAKREQQQVDGVAAGEEGAVAVAQGESWGVEKAQKANAGEDASIWTQLALAYAIHKSFIFIRVPLTAAVTPKVVKTLRGWGWNIGKRKTT